MGWEPCCRRDVLERNGGIGHLEGCKEGWLLLLTSTARPDNTRESADDYEEVGQPRSRAAPREPSPLLRAANGAARWRWPGPVCATGTEPCPGRGHRLLGIPAGVTAAPAGSAAVPASWASRLQSHCSFPVCSPGIELCVAAAQAPPAALGSPHCTGTAGPALQLQKPSTELIAALPCSQAQEAGALIAPISTRQRVTGRGGVRRGRKRKKKEKVFAWANTNSIRSDGHGCQPQ